MNIYVICLWKGIIIRSGQENLALAITSLKEKGDIAHAFTNQTTEKLVKLCKNNI